jgi:queuine tRNA-ribosyltransferase
MPEATDGDARAGRLVLPHGIVETPAFMPVGTHGTVRGLHPARSSVPARRSSWAIPITCTCAPARTWSGHGRAAPILDLAQGDAHRFGRLSGLLAARLRKVGEDGVEFVSHIDGRCEPSPRIGDGDPMGPRRRRRDGVRSRGAGPGDARSRARGMERTLRWLQRCRSRHDALSSVGQSVSRSKNGPTDRQTDCQQTLWPIIQGGTHADLRLRSLEGTLALGPWTGSRSAASPSARPSR